MADVEKSPSPSLTGNGDGTKSPDSSNVAIGEDTAKQGLWQNIWTTIKGQPQDPDAVGRHLLAQAAQYDPAQMEADAARVQRKLDFILLPMMCGTYMISFLDKQTLNYSNAYGLQEDTNMSGDDYSWVASALNFGWLLAAYPWNLLLQRYPIGRLIGCMLFVWGSVCMLQAAVFDFGGFFTVRFFLGALEACVSPAFILLTSMFWIKEEQSLRSSFWLACNGFASIIGALLAYGCGHAVGLAVPNWKLIYLIVGVITIGWGVVIVLYLPDGPHNAKFLTDYEKAVAVWRVSRNRIGLKHKETKTYQIREAFLDIRVWLIWLMGASIGVLNGGVVNFASALIKGFGYDALQASLMQTPGGGFEIVGCIIFGYISSFQGWLCWAIVLSSLPGMAGLIGLLTIDADMRLALTAMAWLQNVVGAPIILSWTLSGVNVGGHTKRTTTIGIFFVMYCAGNICSPHMFLAEEEPRYHTAIKGLLGAYCALIVFTISYWATCFSANKIRDRKGEKGDSLLQEGMEGFEDLTDKENQHFRYRT